MSLSSASISVSLSDEIDDDALSKKESFKLSLLSEDIELLLNVDSHDLP
jgi:hypothetical protein